MKHAKTIVVVVILVLLAIPAFFLRNSKPEAKPNENGSDAEYSMKDLAENWLKSLDNQRPDQALLLATFMIKDLKSDIVVDKWYVDVFQKQGISRKFLEGKFTIYDFRYWKRALLLKRIAEQAKGKTDDETLKNLVELVHKRIEPVAFDGDIALPYFIWERRKGLCDKQVWLLAALAYQLGFETRIVWLMNPETKQSPHTICEIRKNGFTAIADPLKNIYLPKTSVFSLAENPSLLKKIWPDKPLWQKSVKGSHLMVPSDGPDFCLRNQFLAMRLSKLLGDKMPRFGEDPKKRKMAFEKCLAKQEFINNAKYPKGLYNYPLMSLRQTIQKSGALLQALEEQEKEAAPPATGTQRDSQQKSGE